MTADVARVDRSGDTRVPAAERLAWTAWALTVAAAVGTVVLADAMPSATADGVTRNDVLDAGVGLLLLSWVTTGAIVVSRRPAHPIGWLLLSVGVAGRIEALAGAFAQWSLQTGTEVVDAAHVAVVADLVWIPSLVASATFVPLLFPDGRLPSARWRPVAWVAAGAAAVSVPATLLHPGPLYYLPRTPNPFGVDTLEGPLQIVEVSVTVAAFWCSLLAIAGLVVRYHRARGIRRLQLRWFVLALVILAVSVPPAVFFADTSVGSVLFEVCWALPPIAIGVALLRYRLYDLDRLVSRTVTYAAVTAVLVAVYALVATLPSAVFDLESDLSVAAATLAAAAAFVPVRRRVQLVVDRRFNRARYDAQRVVERFGTQLRDDIDLHHLSSDLRGVVASTVQPAHVSVWMAGSTSP